MPNGKSFAQEYEDPDGRAAELEIVALAGPHAPPRPWGGPVEIDLEFRMPVRPSWAPWERAAALEGALVPTGKADVDNCCKIVMDSLQRSGAWFEDDAQVIALRARKVYAPAGEMLVVVRFLREFTREELVARAQKEASLFEVGGRDG